MPRVSPKKKAVHALNALAVANRMVRDATKQLRQAFDATARESDRVARNAIGRIAARDPLIPSEVDGSLSCFFCGEWAAGTTLAASKHEPTCLWREATEIVARAKGGSVV